MTQSPRTVRSSTPAAGTTRRPTSTVAVQRNDTLDLPQYAYEQLLDAKRGQANARTNTSRVNASLPVDSWHVIDDQMYEVYQDTTVIVGDLRAAGLEVGRDIMQKFDSWNLVDDSGEAEVDMTPETATPESTVSHGMDGVPVPIIHDDFSIGFREGSAANSMNPTPDSLETLGAAVTTRHVTERIEELVIGNPNGAPYQVGSHGDTFKLYGLTDHPDTNTSTFDENWTTTNEADDGTTLRTDIRRMRSILKNDNNVRPGGEGYWLYFGTNLFDALDNVDTEGDGNMVQRERIENLANIGQIRESEFLPEDSALMFRATNDIVDLGVANDIQMVQWEDPFRDYWKCLASIYPRVKSTTTGQSGIAYFTAS